jgi:hypothetical protein
MPPLLILLISCHKVLTPQRKINKRTQQLHNASIYHCCCGGREKKKQMSEKISSQRFYNEYHGHRVEDLVLLHSHLRSHQNKRNNNPLIFLAGDSSLDNKHWFRNTNDALNGYEDILSPPQSRQDIAYWMNYALTQIQLDTKSNSDDNNNPLSSSKPQQQKQGHWSVINCAIEESTVGARSCGRLLPQDHFISDNIQSQDILIISVGGNDIALHPSLCTILNLLCLTFCPTQFCIDQSCGTAIPCDEYFGGCTSSCFSNFLAFPYGFGYFIHLFKTRIQSLINKLISKQSPKHIYVCMIYYLDETPGNSWAEVALSGMQYNQNPKKLQSIISQLFELATKQIQIPGTTVTGIPLFRILDGKDPTDYIERVEPSAKGGKKMGMFLVNEIMEELKSYHQEEMDR